ncbi:MAG: cysteine synthase family protein [Eubacteriales bacterium]
MKTYDNLTEIIGKTPLVRLHSLSDKAEIYAKCEFLNPFSLKDRPVLNIIEAAAKRGDIKPGSTLIEATSGNTGMALAYISALKGYKTILVMSEIQSVERRQIMKALGAELILTPKELGTKGAKAKLLEIKAEHPDYFYVCQHDNSDNPDAHYKTTGPELWEDTDGKLDMIIAGVGTGGTLCGIGRYLKEQNPDIKTIGIEPLEAPYVSEGKFTPHRMMGLAPGFLPANVDKSIIDEFELVSTDEAFEMCRFLAKNEGMLVGITSGAVACVLKRLAEREENQGKMLAGIFGDSGQRYLSVSDLFTV